MGEFPGSRGGRYDYELGEHYTGLAWVDGLPIYRRVEELSGGNGTTAGGAIPDLNNLSRDTIVRVDFAIRSPFSGNLFFYPEQVNINDTTGGIQVLHTGVDLTGITLHVIVEYTRVQS